MVESVVRRHIWGGGYTHNYVRRGSCELREQKILCVHHKAEGACADESGERRCRLERLCPGQLAV